MSELDNEGDLCDFIFASSFVFLENFVVELSLFLFFTFENVSNVRLAIDVLEPIVENKVNLINN